jgi:hypothetical protein
LVGFVAMLGLMRLAKLLLPIPNLLRCRRLQSRSQRWAIGADEATSTGKPKKPVVWPTRLKLQGD